MYRISLFAVAVVCLVAMSSDSASAQFYNPYNSGYNSGGGCNTCGGGGNYTDPRLGYCLTNDCIGQQGCNQCGGGGGGCATGGCGGGCGSSAIIVRVRVNGQSTTPSVQTYYPGVTSGCSNCYGNNTRQNNNKARMVNQPAKAASSRAKTQRASYRYKF